MTRLRIGPSNYARNGREFRSEVVISNALDVVSDCMSPREAVFSCDGEIPCEKPDTRAPAAPSSPLPPLKRAPTTHARRRLAIDTFGYASTARRVRSPNYDARPQGVPIDVIVVHGISLPPGEFGGEAI